MADFLYPLILKVQLHAEEPLACKGGKAVDIEKTLVLPVPPAHKWVQRRLVKIAQHLIKGSQCGGDLKEAMI